MAIPFAQRHAVKAVDIIEEKEEKTDKRIRPVQGDCIGKYPAGKEMYLTAALDAEAAYRDADFVVIAVRPITTARPNILTRARRKRS